MNTTAQTVREIALEQPTSIRVFEHFGIDYCCGGRKPLAEACAASNLEVDAVIAALEAAARGPVPGRAAAVRHRDEHIPGKLFDGRELAGRCSYQRQCPSLGCTTRDSTRSIACAE